MKKAAVAAVMLLVASTIVTGCGRKEVEEAIAPLVADVQTETEAEDLEEAEEEPVIPEIDTSLPIQEGARIAVVSKNTKGEFWDMVREGMEDAVEAVNTAYGFSKDQQITMTFEGAKDEQDIESQVNTLDAVIAENPTVLCISVGDADSCQAQLEAAKENGIPVIAFDSNVTETKLIRAFRGTDNTKVGEMAAYRLATALGKMGKVAVFSEQEKTQSAKDRTEGFLNYISNYTDIEVMEVVYQDQVDDMVAAMQEVLDRYPNLDGVFCTNADVSEMYLNMEKDDITQQIAMVGVDATSRQIEAVKNGEEIGIISQQPYAIGYQTMWTAIMATAPKKQVEIQKNVLLDAAWISLSNLDDPSYSSYLYTRK
jgi:ribose transport system substrate-binding protein